MLRVFNFINRMPFLSAFAGITIMLVAISVPGCAEEEVCGDTATTESGDTGTDTGADTGEDTGSDTGSTTETNE